MSDHESFSDHVLQHRALHASLWLLLLSDNVRQSIFKIAGQKNAAMSSLAVGLVNFGMSIISLWIVNSFGRRRLLFVGLTGQICGLAIAAAPLLAPTNSVSAAAGWIMVSGVLLFVVFFAFSSGPLAWVRCPA